MNKEYSQKIISAFALYSSDEEIMKQTGFSADILKKYRSDVDFMKQVYSYRMRIM